MDERTEPEDAPAIGERTEAPERAVEGDASPVPDAFFWALWVGAFFVILWGMLVLFRRRAPDS